jgi:hypothetical protein
MKYHRPFALVAAAAVLSLTACGDDDPSADVADTTAETAAPVPPTSPSGTQPDPAVTSTPTTDSPIEDGVLTIEMSDFAFGGLPASVPAGTRLAVENTSSTELHEIVALRIADTELRSAAELMALPQTELQAVAGPVPATVLAAAPGGSQIDVLGDGTLAEPGRYLLLCAIPTGVDPAEYLNAAAESAGPPDVAGGPPHFVHGMFAELIVG